MYHQHTFTILFPAQIGRRSAAVTRYAAGPSPDPWIILAVTADTFDMVQLHDFVPYTFYNSFIYVFIASLSQLFHVQQNIVYPSFLSTFAVASVNMYSLLLFCVLDSTLFAKHIGRYSADQKRSSSSATTIIAATIK